MRVPSLSMFRHLWDYVVLVRWLGGKALASFGGRIVLGAALSLASVATELFAFYLIVQVLHALELSGVASAKPMASSLNLSHWPRWAMAVAPALVLALSAALTFYARSIAIGLQTRFARHIGEELAAGLDRSLWGLDRMSPPLGLSEDHLLRAIGTDTMACGLALRMALLNVINVVSLFVGLGIIAFVAPTLMLLWAAVAAVLLPALYLVNLRALREARKLSDLAPAYRGALIQDLRALYRLDSRSGDAGEDIADRYNEALDSRLRIVEVSRLVLTAVFAAAIATLLWVAQQPEAKALFNIVYLMLLFLAFRYAYQGIQGLSVFVTSINRFLPSLLNLFDLSRKLAALEPRRDRMQQLQGQGLPSEFKWSIELPNGQSRSGALRPGKPVAIVIPGQAKVAAAAQLLPLLKGRSAELAFIAQIGREPAIIGGADIPAISKIEGSLSWYLELLKALGHDVTTEQAQALIRGEPVAGITLQDWVLPLAHAIDAAGRQAPHVILLDGNAMQRLTLQARDVLLDRLSHHLVCSITNRLESLLKRHPYDSLFISTGQRIAAVLPETAQLDEQMRAEAKAVYGSEKLKASAASGTAADLAEAEMQLM